MLISVVVPTYNSRELVRQAIISLNRQTLPCTDYEVIIVDDGSDDGTGEAIQGLQTCFLLRCFYQENRGRAAARNLGARQARGQVLLFLDADMEATPALLKAHISTHKRNTNVLVQGRVCLASDVADTPYARVYPGDSVPIDRDGFISAAYCATGNLSIMREAFIQLGEFDESFQSYGWEDTEFGCRAARAGFRLYYRFRALSYHHDRSATLRTASERLYRASRSVGTLVDKCPELAGSIAMFQDHGFINWKQDAARVVLRKVLRGIMITPPVLKTLEGIAAATEMLCPSPVLLRPLYRWVIGSYICRGYRESLVRQHD